MNLVFLLSEPVDFSPIYDRKIPLELIPYPGQSLYERNYDEWKGFFPSSHVYVIDPGNRPTFHRIAGNADSLNIPSSNLFTKLFLFSSFATAHSISSLSLFVPANYFYKDIKNIAKSVIAALKTPLCPESLTFFSIQSGHSARYIQKGEILFQNHSIQVRGINNFITLSQYLVWKEKNMDVKDSPYVESSSIILLNTIRFREYIVQKNESFHDLFLLLERMWRDSTTPLSMLSETSSVLDSFVLEDTIEDMEDLFLINLSTTAERIDTLMQFLNTLPRDQAGNYISGNVIVENVQNSLLINESLSPYYVSNLKNILALSKNGVVKIRSLI